MHEDVRSTNYRLLQDYITKILALRREREGEELREDELERIALEAGLSREDLQYARKSFQDYLNRGRVEAFSNTATGSVLLMSLNRQSRSHQTFPPHL